MRGIAHGVLHMGGFSINTFMHVSHSFSLPLAPPCHQGALDKGSKGDLLRRCADLLKRYRVTLHHSIQYILHARVPIITFKDSMHREIYQGLP